MSTRFIVYRDSYDGRSYQKEGDYAYWESTEYGVEIGAVRMIDGKLHYASYRDRHIFPLLPPNMRWLPVEKGALK